MDNKKVEQVLKEIFDQYGTEIVQNRRNFLGAVYDLLSDEWKYKDERTILKFAIESNAIPILLFSLPITSDSAQRAVEQIRKDTYMDSEAAKFVVQCVVAACGYNPDIVTENEKRRQEEEAERIRKEEERIRREEEQRRQEEERKQREEDQRRQEEERKRREEEQKRQEEERKRREEEQKRQEEERKKQVEEQKRQEKERKQREEEQKRHEEERKRREEEQKQHEEERKKQEGERRLQEEEQKQQIKNKKKQWEIVLAFFSIPSVMWGFIGIMSWVLGKGADDDISDVVVLSLIAVACQCYLVFKTSKTKLVAWIGIVIGLIGIGCIFMIL